MAIKNQQLPLQDLPKFTQIGIFGLKIYHLATLELLPTFVFQHVSNISNHICGYAHGQKCALTYYNLTGPFTYAFYLEK
jgi:hypothetical protein